MHKIRDILHRKTCIKDCEFVNLFKFEEDKRFRSKEIDKNI